MSTQNRPYQGYPYVNPVVIDVPSIDATTAAKWTNLPRRPIAPHTTTDSPGTSRGDERSNADTAKESSDSDRTVTENNPVVYIDVPDCGGSSVLENQTNRPEQTEVNFVQDTIFYDPFKNRRIQVQVTGDESDEEVAPSRIPARSEQYSRPVPPSSLQVTTPGNSSGVTTSPTFGTSTNPNLPGLMSKEALYYGRQPTPDDGFPLGPIPVSEFPEPPPAYTEIDRAPATEPPRPPRTEVVTTVTDASTTIRPGSDRKLLQCPHCGRRVHSLVVREVGAFTHILALVFTFLCLIPIVILIYCTDSCKYKNHYCPNCNQLIGYEIPILCQQMAFV